MARRETLETMSPAINSTCCWVPSRIWRLFQALDMQTEKHGWSLHSWSLEPVPWKQTVDEVIKSADLAGVRAMGTSKGSRVSVDGAGLIWTKLLWKDFPEMVTFKRRSEKQRIVGIGPRGQSHWVEGLSQKDTISKATSAIFRQLIERQSRIVSQNSKNV